MSAAASVVWRVESARRWIGFDRVHRLELAMTILAVLLWIAAMPVLLDGKNYMATRGTSVENANVFFSTWASFGLVTFLLASVVSEACFNVVGGGGGASSGNIGSGSGMNNHRRTILWISMFFFANAVLGSSLSLYSSPICQGMLSSSRMCASSMVTIVTSILTNVLCFMALTLSYVMHSRLKKHAARQSSSSSSSSSQPWALSTKQSMKLQSQSKTTNKITSLLAIASLTIQSVGTTYVTSPGGMGFVSGNLFLSSWSCTILAFLLCLDYVNHVYLDAVVSGGSSGRYGAPVKQALHFSYNGNTASMHSTSMATSIGNITDSTSTAYDTEEELVEDVHHHHPAIAAPFSEGISMAETETEASASVVPDARGSVNGQHFGSSGVPPVPASQIGLQPDASAIEEEQFEVPANRGYGYYHHPSQGVGQDPEPEQQDVGYDASTEFGNVESMASFTPSFQGAEVNGRKYNLKASLTRNPSFYSEHPDGGGIMSVSDSEMGGTRSKSTKSSRSLSSSKRSSSKNKAKGDKPLQHHNGGGRKNKNAKASAEASGMKYNLKASMYADEAVLSVSESEMTSSTKSPSFNRPAVKRTREQQPSRYPPPPPPPSQRTNDNTKRETFIVPTFKPKTGSFTSYQGNAQSSYVSVPSFNSAPHPVPPPPPRSKASKSVSTTSSSGTTPRTVDERSTGTHLTETDHSGPLTETDHSGPIRGKNNRIHGSAESWSTGLDAKSSSDVSSRRPTSKSPGRKSPGRNHPSQSSSRSPRAMRPRTPQPPPRPVNEPVMPAAVAAAYQPRRGTIKSRRQDQGDFNKSSKILSSESITHGLYDPMQSKTISLEDSDSIISDPTMDGSIMTSRQKGVVREKQVNHAVAAALAHAEVFKKSSTSNISMRKSTKSGTAGPDVDKIVAAAIAAATSKTNLTSSQISWRNSSTTSRAKSHAPPPPPPKPHEQSQGEEKSTDIEFDKSTKSIHSFYSNFVHSKASSKASSASLTNSDFGFDC